MRKNDVNSCCLCLSPFTHETISTLLIEAISRMHVTYRRSSVARCGVSVAQWQGIRARNPKIWCTITDEDVGFFSLSYTWDKTNEHLPPEPFKFNLPSLLSSFNLVFRSRGSNVKWVNFSMFFLLHFIALSWSLHSFGYAPLVQAISNWGHKFFLFITEIYRF